MIDDSLFQDKLGESFNFKDLFGIQELRFTVVVFALFSERDL